MTTSAKRMTPFDVSIVGGIPFQVTDLKRASQWLIHDASPRHLAVNIRLANAYNVALAADDDSYRNVLVEQGINFPDGKPVVWFMNRRVPSNGRARRVRGPSLFQAAMSEGVAAETRHFLLGSTPETLSSLVRVLTERFAGVVIAGSYSPPFAPLDDAYLDDCTRRIADARADIVWVALGTPKQDVLGTALAPRVGLPTVNVGAAFDFMAGTVREAPPWVQESGFEWFYRMMTEPRRLWRRYIFGNAKFLRAALRNSRPLRVSK